MIHLFTTLVEVQLGGHGADQMGSEGKAKRRDQNTSPKEVLSVPL